MNLQKVLIGFMVLAITGCGGPKKVAGPGEEAQYITVEAEGTADITAAGNSEATDRAYDSAQRKAIETALGRIYSARTVVESGRFIEQNIMSKIEGYIRDWEKLQGPEIRQYPGTEVDMVWVLIKAQVGKDRLSEDTLALQKIQQRLGRPDIAITVNNDQAKQVIEGKLKDKKFTVRDIGNNLQDPFEKANSENVEIIITGDATAKSAGAVMEGVSMKSYQAEVRFKALNVTDGAILAESSSHAASAHIEENSGKTAAIKKASNEAAKDLIEKMVKGWEDILNNGSDIYLSVKGLTLSNESDFERFLENSVRGVKEIHSRGMEDGINSFKVKYLGDARQFAQLLNDAQGEFNANVTSYKVNTVEAEID